ncbi:OB-fold domain-containing protein [Caballeronia sp. ATUFL_M2_KS44]|uniref:Zn-ribbon domain-containing OB-fold protein n=1 Tax=Caballeronia sp. ATUFL_M2_KS44 TaxID=2921767 RepID=UPI002027D20B|nr:OB-fold domain-containing protein [Caballeronia sp. ATUFL_M2_KS44]
MSDEPTEVPRTPQPVMGMYDAVMWQSISNGALELQHCACCDTTLYPPAPVCPHCLSDGLQWRAVSGRGTVLSWVVYHKTYLDAYPAPYNVIAVRLDEGAVLISNLEAPLPEESWIGRKVSMIYSTMPDGLVLPRFVLSERNPVS